MERERTFYDHEELAYDWINHLRQVFDLKRLEITERYNKEKYQWSWKVKVRFV